MRFLFQIAKVIQNLVLRIRSEIVGSDWRLMKY
jgi:hypothetical protein